jgi:hypothetical protein
MEMSSAPDIRRRPHRALLAPGGNRLGKAVLLFKRQKMGSQKFF